jgi:hypothetical protein
VRRPRWLRQVLFPSQRWWVNLLWWLTCIPLMVLLFWAIWRVAYLALFLPVFLAIRVF